MHRPASRRSRTPRPPARPRTHPPAAARHLIHAFASPAVIEENGPLTLTRGRGAYVWDSSGRKYLDGLSSLWNVAIGHGRAEIARAVAAQMRRLAYAPTLLGFSSEPAQKLAARIARMAPRGLTRVFFCGGGSEANESAIRLVRLYRSLEGEPEKIKIVALDGAYHGSSTGAASLTGLATFHRRYEPLMPGVIHMVRPHCARCALGKTYPDCGLACADELERIVEREGAGAIGAFIAEPVQGVGGVIVPPPGYFERIREICDRHRILLIVDEVITGFGRLGVPFGIQRWKAAPDLVVFAKCVTSGYLPLGGVIMREGIYGALLAAGPELVLHHGFTYSGHPAVCAAGLANLDIIEREGLIGRVRRLAPYFARRLRALERLALVIEVRCAGLMAAVELAAGPAMPPGTPPIPVRVRQAALARGVIVRASADAVVLCPPFVVTREEIDRLAGVLGEAIEEVGRDSGGSPQ